MNGVCGYQMDRLLVEVEAASEAILHDVACCEREGRFASGAFDELKSRGLLSICASRLDGGAGIVRLKELTYLIKALSKIDASVATAAQMHLVLSWYFARSARLSPDGPRKQLHSDWIRQIGQNQMIVSSAVSEPGQDARSPLAMAKKASTGWIINGVKNIATNAPGATHFYTRVKLDAPNFPKLASVMIPFDKNTVTINDDWDGLGLRVSGSCSVSFVDALVPHDSLTVGGEWGPSKPESSYEGRLASVAPLLGVSLGIIEGVRQDCSDAHSRRTTKHLNSADVNLLSEVELQLTTCRAVVDALLVRLDTAFHDVPPGRLPVLVARELMGETVSAGIMVERAATSVCDLAMQFCGGQSYQATHPLARRSRDARALFFMRPLAPTNGWRDFLVERLLQVAPRSHLGPTQS